MNEKPSKGLTGSTFEFLFVSVPVWLGKKLDGWVKNQSSSWVKIIAYLSTLLAALTTIWSIKYLNGFVERFEARPWTKAGVAATCLYSAYLLITLPFFMLTGYAMKNSKDTSSDDKKRRLKRISSREITKQKTAVEANQAYLGTSYWSGKGCYLTDDMRLMHTHVVGSTGVGKTESVMLPLLKRDIERGRGAIVVDAKGDLELLAKIRYFVQINGRKDDFLFFSLSHPEISDTYNPLLRGNASEIKDKLIGSTEWREEFYRKKAEEAALTLLRALVSLNRKVRFRDLYELLTDKNQLRALIAQLDDIRMSKDLEVMKDMFHDNTKFLSGFIADLGLVTKSEFSRLTDSQESKIDLLEVYQKNKIVYFALNTQGYEETAKRFGRLILQDIKTVSNYIQTQMEEGERHFFPVYVDEFSSFVYENFIDFMNKARGAKLAVTLLHQSLADLAAKRMTFQQQILENTNVKIIMRQDDPFSIDKYSKIGGSRRTFVSTYQTESGMLGTDMTGRGSVREAQTFRIDPDLVRSLGRGEAIVVMKYPSFKIDYLRLSSETDINLTWIHMKIKDERERATEHWKRESAKPEIVQDESDQFQTLSDTAHKFEKIRGAKR